MIYFSEYLLLIRRLSGLVILITFFFYLKNSKVKQQTTNNFFSYSYIILRVTTIEHDDSKMTKFTMHLTKVYLRLKNSFQQINFA